MLDDRHGGVEGVRSDAHHYRVAGTHHASGVGEHVGTTLEHEADDAQRRSPGIDGPPVVGDRAERGVATQRRVLPAAKTSDHVGQHPFGEDETSRRPTRRRSCGDIALVGVADRRDDAVVGEAVGEGGEERRDLFVGHLAEGRKRLTRRVDRGRGDVLDGCGDVEEVARVDDEEAVAGLEGRGQLVTDRHVAIGADEDRLPWLQTFERQRTAHAASVGCGA